MVYVLSRPPARSGCRRFPTSCHLQGGGRDAVALLAGAQAVPLLHGRAVRVQHAAPVVGLGRAGRVLPDHNSPDEVVAALHVVPVHWGEQKQRVVKAKAPLAHPEPGPGNPNVLQMSPHIRCQMPAFLVCNSASEKMLQKQGLGSNKISCTTARNTIQINKAQIHSYHGI